MIVIKLQIFYITGTVSTAAPVISVRGQVHMRPNRIVHAGAGKEEAGIPVMNKTKPFRHDREE